MAEARLGIDSFVLALTTAATTHGIYPQSHPATRESLENVVRELGTVVESGEVTLLVVDDELAVDGRPWNRTSPSRGSLARALGRAGIESLSIQPSVRPEEVERLVLSLAGSVPAESSAHVEIGRVKLHAGDGGSGDGASAFPSLEGRLDEAHEALAGFRQDASRGFQRLEGAVWSLIEATARDSRSFVLLSSVKADDDRLWRHALNVCLYTTHFGRALGLEGSLLHDLGVGALLHDIGYVSLPGDPAELPPETRRTHPQLGAAHLAGVAGIAPLPILIAFEHHVHWGGGGYPQTTWRPNLASQITSVADWWDMLMEAPGPPSRSLRFARAARHLRKLAGGVLNPHLVALFLELLEAPDS